MSETGGLTREAKRRGALLIHYPTDNVFDGKLRRALPPPGPSHPANDYGRTRLGGKRVIQAVGGPSDPRTSWLYGAGGNDFLTMVEDGNSLVHVNHGGRVCSGSATSTAEALRRSPCGSS